MITTREARLAAEAWLREEAGRHPELVGAILAGSTSARDPEEPHPPSAQYVSRERSHGLSTASISRLGFPAEDW